MNNLTIHDVFDLPPSIPRCFLKILDLNDEQAPTCRESHRGTRGKLVLQEEVRRLSGGMEEDGGGMTAMKMQQVVHNPYHPFDFRAENFVGRQEILQHMRRRVTLRTAEYESSKHVTLLGDGGTGKTWLMQKYLADLPDSRFWKVYLDVGNYVEDLEGFLAAFGSQVGYVPRRHLSVGDFLKSVQVGLPVAIAVSPFSVFTRQMPVGLEERLSDLTAYIVETAIEKDRFFVLALDNYGLLSQMQAGSQIVRHMAFLMRACQKEKLAERAPGVSAETRTQRGPRVPVWQRSLRSHLYDSFQSGLFCR